ncbi:MAG: AI-2E family transporter [Candidatus Moranbacteria bacterium]|nr:AI-2E family transporter [Candidatus Moranbacteria bacterium]
MTVNEHVEVGTKVLIRMAIMIGIVYVAYLLRDIVLLVLLAVLTAAALSPAIVRLRRFGLSRTASVIIAYAVLFSVGVILLAVFLPLFFSEIKQFLENWPEYTERLDTFIGGIQSYLHSIGVDWSKEEFFQGLDNDITMWFSQIFSTTVNLFQGFIHFIGYFFLALYLSLEEQGIEKFFLLMTPKEYHDQARSIASRMQGKVSQWLFGQMLLMVIAFVIYFIGLSLLGVPYALAIAFFGGFMEILPYVGPVLAAVPAIIIGLLSSPILGASALVFYIIAHQVEAHIVAPQVMKHSAGLNPVALIIAILVGLELGGALGIILAVPITMILSVFVEDLLLKKSNQS